MKEINIKLTNDTGLHARPASIFVQKASKFESDITLIKDGNDYNGKSIMGILSMGGVKDDEITIKAEGKDEKEAIDALKALVENDFKS
ncbi:MAG: HPr family phosphocarrier protein [Firmicutes bacterium]|nr:HPr family phosphocarrier protein [Bacillota bacterium]